MVSLTGSPRTFLDPTPANIVGRSQWVKTLPSLIARMDFFTCKLTDGTTDLALNTNAILHGKEARDFRGSRCPGSSLSLVFTRPVPSGLAVSLLFGETAAR